MTANFFVIIVTYNAMKWAERCFGSLRRSSVPVKTIVVDNGSTDGTQDFIKNNFPEVEFIQSEENLGFGKANNIGIEKAYKQGAEFFYLMNQDVWIFEDSFEKLLVVYENHPHKEEIGILSPMHLDGSEENLEIFIDKYIAQNFKNRLISDLYFNKAKKFYEVGFINAAHWLITKDTIEKVGGFNPFFFHYGEDNEYVNRVHYHKKKILLCTECRAVHDGTQDLNKVDYTKYQDYKVETKILDPNLNGSWQTEISELRKSILKNIVLRDFSRAKILMKKLNGLKKQKEILSFYAQEVRLAKASFLDLQ